MFESCCFMTCPADYWDNWNKMYFHWRAVLSIMHHQTVGGKGDKTTSVLIFGWCFSAGVYVCWCSCLLMFLCAGVFVCSFFFCAGIFLCWYFCPLVFLWAGCFFLASVLAPGYSWCCFSVPVFMSVSISVSLSLSLSSPLSPSRSVSFSLSTRVSIYVCLSCLYLNHFKSIPWSVSVRTCHSGMSYHSYLDTVEPHFFRHSHMSA